MMLTFELGGEVILVKVLGNNILFTTSETNFQQYAPIDGLRLSKDGILKENPDLKDLPNTELRKKAVERFKEHIKKLDNEGKIGDYLILELGKCGYQLKTIQKEGFRVKKVK